jgi:hypothetical protein
MCYQINSVFGDESFHISARSAASAITPAIYEGLIQWNQL